MFWLPRRTPARKPAICLQHRGCSSFSCQLARNPATTIGFKTRTLVRCDRAPSRQFHESPGRYSAQADPKSPYRNCCRRIGARQYMPDLRVESLGNTCSCPKSIETPLQECRSLLSRYRRFYWASQTILAANYVFLERTSPDGYVAAGVQSFETFFLLNLPHSK